MIKRNLINIMLAICIAMILACVGPHLDEKSIAPLLAGSIAGPSGELGNAAGDSEESDSWGQITYIGMSALLSLVTTVVIFGIAGYLYAKFWN